MKAMDWTTACPDWEKRIVQRRSLVPFEPLFPDEAEAALAVFKSLRIWDVPGQPTFGEACDTFVFEFVGAIFGAYDAAHARRLINEFFLLISKKNAKSTIAAGIMVTALIRNWRIGAELLILAPSIEVAQNSFIPAAAMIRLDAELIDLLHINDNERKITHRTTEAVLKVISADSKVAAGKKAAYVLVDELWMFGHVNNATGIIAEATGGMSGKPEGFLIYLSTHSDQAPAGIFLKTLRYYRAIRDGRIKASSKFGMLYEWPAKMLKEKAYLDPENFYVTNPNIGRSVGKEWLADKLLQYQTGDGTGVADDEAQDDIGDIQTFLAKHLNVEIGIGLNRDRWGGADLWDAAADTSITLDSLIKRCDVAVVGIDGGGRDDWIGLAVIGRERETRDWLGWAHAWFHPVALKRRKNIADRLLDFVAEGSATQCERETQDLNEIVAVCLKLKAAGLLPDRAAIGLDRAQAIQISDSLAEAGFSIGAADSEAVSVPQGYLLQPAIHGLQRKLADGTFRHHGSEMMRWVVGNAKVELRGSAHVIEKQTAGSGKIDPLVALFDAVILMGRNPEGIRTSVYNTRGIVFI